MDGALHSEIRIPYEKDGQIVHKIRLPDRVFGFPVMKNLVPVNFEARSGHIQRIDSNHKSIRVSG